MECTYRIGSITYTQTPLVLRQVEQLIAALDGCALPVAAGPLAIVTALGPRLAPVLAIVLTPEGTSLRQKDVAAVAEQLRDDMDLETPAQVVADFFACNPVASICDRWTTAVERATGTLPTA